MHANTAFQAVSMITSSSLASAQGLEGVALEVPVEALVRALLLELAWVPEWADCAITMTTMTLTHNRMNVIRPLMT